jgi:hypothetical protein
MAARLDKGEHRRPRQRRNFLIAPRDGATIAGITATTDAAVPIGRHQGQHEGTLNTVRNAGGVVTDDQQHPRILLRRDDWRA